MAIVAIFVTTALISRSGTMRTDSRITVYSSDNTDSPTYMEVRARVINVDPEAGTMAVRLIVIPHGAYRSPIGALTVPMTIDVAGVPGGSASFDAGRITVPVESTVGMAGDVSQYPFDSYKALLAVELNTTKGNVPVAMDLTVQAGQRDWLVHPSKLAIQQGKALTVTVGISRGAASIGFALFEMAVMVILASIALAITYTTVIAARPLEFSYFTWLGALIFALPAVRNTMPGSPSVGTAVDVAVFFPCLATVALCMLSAAITFVRRANANR